MYVDGSYRSVAYVQIVGKGFAEDHGEDEREKKIHMHEHEAWLSSQASEISEFVCRNNNNNNNNDYLRTEARIFEKWQ